MELIACFEQLSSGPLLIPKIAGFDFQSFPHEPVFDKNIGGVRRRSFSMALPGGGVLVNDLFISADRLICVAKYRLDSDHELEAWDVTVASVAAAAESVHAYVGAHGEHGIGAMLRSGDAKISTASHNWAYCPLTPRVAFCGGGNTMVVGGTSPAHDFGFQYKAESGKFDYLRFDYGGEEFPRKLTGGVWHHGPRLQVLLARDSSVHEAHADFTRAMLDDGVVAPWRRAPEAAFWDDTSYCTWGDQNEIARAVKRQDQAGSCDYSAMKAALDETLVRRAAGKIRACGLPINTIIIDDGWQDLRGDWNLDTGKFTDMRRLTDDLHNMGFRVAFWWAPFLTEPRALVLGSNRVVGPVKHEQIVIDYGKQETREWLSEKLDLWFDDGPGQWNMDGVKLDFMMEKIFPRREVHDPEWYGEERVCCRLLATIEAAFHSRGKPSGIFSIPYSPNLMRFAALGQLEERHDSDFTFMAEKRLLIKALMPGMRFATHFNFNIAAVPDHIRAARANGFVPQIGLLLAECVSPQDVDRIRVALNEVG